MICWLVPLMQSRVYLYGPMAFRCFVFDSRKYSKRARLPRNGREGRPLREIIRIYVCVDPWILLSGIFPYSSRNTFIHENNPNLRYSKSLEWIFFCVYDFGGAF